MNCAVRFNQSGVARGAVVVVGSGMRYLMLSMILFVAIAVGGLSREVVMNPLEPGQLIIVPPSDFRGVRLAYSPAELKIVVPHIHLVACIYTQHLIRHWLRPAAVSFEPCPQSPFSIKFTDDLIFVSVSGSAKADGRDVSFDVDLQHYPTATELSGFQTLSVNFHPDLSRAADSKLP